MPQTKIFTPDIAQRASYSFDPTGECFFTGGAAGGYGILPLEGESSMFLLGLLNSSVLDWFLHQTTTPMKGGWYSYEARYIRDLPIPDSTESQRAAIERLVEYLVWLHRNEAREVNLNGGTESAQMAGFFEEWINALVFELFFPSQLHSAGLRFFQQAEAVQLEPIASLKRGVELSRLREKFDSLYRSGHPLRQSLFALDSIEEVRIIQGKA